MCSIQTLHRDTKARKGRGGGGGHGRSIHIYTPSDKTLSQRPRPWSANAVIDRAFVYASLLVSKPSQVPAAVCTPWAHGYRYPLSLYSHKRQKGSRMGHSANLNQHSLPINSVVLKKIPCIPLRVRSLAVRLLPGAYFIPSKPQCSDGAVRRIITGHA